MWAHAMYKFYYVDLAVAPKKAALAKAKAELAAVMANLDKAKAQVKDIEDRLVELNQALSVKIKFRDDQEAAIQLCLDRMGRAVRLIGGLAEEKVRWGKTIKSLEEGLVTVTGKFRSANSFSISLNSFSLFPYFYGSTKNFHHYLGFILF